MYLVFDIETTGLVECKKFNVYPDYKNLIEYDNARIVQIAWILLDANFAVVQQKCHTIKRDNFNISNNKFHGISNKISDVNGTKFEIVMLDFFEALQRATTIVAHNILFDYNVLLHHLYRYNLTHIFYEFSSKCKFCTSFESAKIVKLNMKYICSYYKYPSLQELYTHYFNKKLINAHNALVDTEACVDCFIALLKDNNYKQLKKYKHSS